MTEPVRQWRFYADCRYGQIHVRAAEPAAGPGAKPPLLLLHQSPMSSAMFSLFLPVMAQDRLVMAFDTPGFGLSDPPPAPPTIADYVAAIAEALDALGYGAKGAGAVDVLGSHTGSLLGAELAVERPDLVRKLVVASIGVLTDEQKAMLAHVAKPQPILTDPEDVPNYYRYTVVDGPPCMTPERRLEMFTQRMLSGTRRWWGPNAAYNYDGRPAFEALTIPVQLIVVDDLLADMTRQAKDWIRGAELVDLSDRVPDYGWDISAQLKADVIRPFLDA